MAGNDCFKNGNDRLRKGKLRRRAKSSDQAAKTNIDIGWEKRKSKFSLSERKMKPEVCILMALKMKDDNLSDDKSSLQASVLVFFILSTKSY